MDTLASEKLLRFIGLGGRFPEPETDFCSF